MSKMKKTRKPGGGRKKLKPDYDAGKNLKEQMDAAVALYDSEMSLQAIGEELGLNPIKVRKLLITARVYESDMAEKVQATFEEYRETQDYKTSILSTANTFQLSKASVTSYLPYKKGVYFPSTEKEKISVGAERQRRYRAMKRWRSDPTEENFWGVVLVYAGVKFKTCSGLPFSYEIKKGRIARSDMEARRASSAILMCWAVRRAFILSPLVADGVRAAAALALVSCVLSGLVSKFVSFFMSLLPPCGMFCCLLEGKLPAFTT